MQKYEWFDFIAQHSITEGETQRPRLEEMITNSVEQEKGLNKETFREESEKMFDSESFMNV